VARDLKNIQELEAAGWKVLIVWECQLKEDRHALQKLLTVLDEIRAQGGASESCPKIGGNA
jgi:DNA mismatch endonuclease (patch repair protein)